MLFQLGKLSLCYNVPRFPSTTAQFLWTNNNVRGVHLKKSFSTLQISNSNVRLGKFGTITQNPMRLSSVSLQFDRHMSTSNKSTKPKTLNIPEIKVTIENKIMKILIDREDKKNAITGKMYQALTQTILNANSDDSTNILVITGKGEYFTAGNDMKDIEAIATQEYKHFVDALVDCRKPLVALINGPAIGIGVTMLGLVDAAYASDKATFLTPFSKLKICAEGCSSYTFPLIMGYSKATEMLSFGTKHTAEQALQMGLISAIYPNDKFQEMSWLKVKDMAELPIKSLMYSKDLVRGGDRDYLHKVNAEEAKRLNDCFMSVVKSTMKTRLQFLAYMYYKKFLRLVGKNN